MEYQNKEIFEKLLQEYQQVPRSKKFLCSMARFEDVCQSSGTSLTLFNAITGLDDPYGAVESSRVRRAEIYNTRKDLVKTVEGRHGKSLVLTSKGHKIYFQKYPLARLRKEPWDGNWTIVSYDIPSNRQQNYLRDKLRYNLHHNYLFLYEYREDNHKHNCTDNFCHKNLRILLDYRIRHKDHRRQ